MGGASPPKTAGKWGYRAVMPTPWVPAVREYCRKDQGPSSYECSQPPAAGNRQVRGMTQVQPGIGSRSQGRLWSAKGFLLLLLLPARGWSWLASVCTPAYTSGTQMFPPSLFQQALATNRRSSLLCPQIPGRETARWEGKFEPLHFLFFPVCP